VVGVNCGILDQYTSCVGQAGCALLLDCQDLSSRPVALAPGIGIVICDTRFKRELSGSEYGTRRAQCEEGARLLGAKSLREVSLARFQEGRHLLPEVVARRCQFVIEENERVLALAEALKSGDRMAMSRTMDASFEGACDLYEIAVPAMQAMMNSMLRAPGVIGARQAGAGFGGCMVALVEEHRIADFIQAIPEDYTAQTDLRPEVYQVESAAGAGRINLSFLAPPATAPASSAGNRPSP
jgi:galactokinase